MSGIVGVINLDGAPVSSELLQNMTEGMASRGPDAQRIWHQGEVGLGHAMLRTTFEASGEWQPYSLDGERWIVSDARIDNRDDLIRQLEEIIPDGPISTTDVELILLAYAAWGEDCVNFLLGDFAFAIWDSRKKRLFCARDHFGVKPFFYAQTGRSLVLGSALNCVRSHPDVTDALNDQAIGDFLLFGSNEQPDTTYFTDVKRLPAGHVLIWAEGNLKVRRYWTLPIKDEIRFRNQWDYIERFVELLDESVRDRLRCDRVGIFMSGGMDSSTIAATAHKVLSKGAAPFDLRAFTVVYDHLIPDEERYYSGLVAAKLDIPIHYLAADAYRPYDRWDRGGFQQPEPCHAPMAAITVDQYQQAAVHSRVMLTGEGGDVILRPSFSYLLNLLRSFKLGRVINDVSLYVLKHRRFPRIGFRTRLKNWLHKPVWEPAYPHWLNPDFESRLNLKERWKQVYAEPPLVHPNRPEAYGLLTSPFWASQFETYDPEFTKSPVEVRHPLFDLRLVNYLLALPSMPWGIDKELMRVAMRDRLPELVRLRRKAPLAGDPVVEIMKRENDGWIKALAPAKQLNHYVRWGAVTKTSSEQYTHDQMWINLQPISLNYWLQTVF